MGFLLSFLSHPARATLVLFARFRARRESARARAVVRDFIRRSLIGCELPTADRRRIRDRDNNGTKRHRGYRLVLRVYD